MRSEKEVYDIVLNFAKTDKRIRMVTLEGSRTNTNIPPDDFQDFDITFFVTDMDSFTSDDKWLDIFGERLLFVCTRIIQYFGTIYREIAKPAEPVNGQDERRISCAAVDSPARLC